MAEVFQGTPVIVSVRIDGPEGRMVQYHIAGRDTTDVSVAVKKALEGLPDTAEPIKAKKARKPRRTKAEMAGEVIPQEAATSDVPPPHKKAKKEVWPE